MSNKVIMHDCNENHLIDPLTKEKRMEVRFSDGKWRFSTGMSYNIIIYYCPFCGIKLLILEV